MITFFFFFFFFFLNMKFLSIFIERSVTFGIQIVVRLFLTKEIMRTRWKCKFIVYKSNGSFYIFLFLLLNTLVTYNLLSGPKLSMFKLKPETPFLFLYILPFETLITVLPHN